MGVKKIYPQKSLLMLLMMTWRMDLMTWRLQVMTWRMEMMTWINLMMMMRRMNLMMMMMRRKNLMMMTWRSKMMTWMMMMKKMILMLILMVMMVTLFFTLTITRTHKTLLRLKPVFMGLAGIDNERPITIKNSDGEEWPMELRFDKMYKRWYLTSGWFAFARNNNLSEGDKCVFKFITSEDKLCLVKVTKKRSPTQPPPPRPRREIPAKEVTIELGDVEGAKVVKRSCGRRR